MNGPNFGVVKMPEKPLLNWTKTAQEGVLSAMLVLTPSHILAERCIQIYCDFVGDNNQINVCHWVKNAAYITCNVPWSFGSFHWHGFRCEVIAFLYHFLPAKLVEFLKLKTILIKSSNMYVTCFLDTLMIQILVTSHASVMREGLLDWELWNEKLKNKECWSSEA